MRIKFTKAVVCDTDVTRKGEAAERRDEDRSKECTVKLPVRAHFQSSHSVMVTEPPFGGRGGGRRAGVSFLKRTLMRHLIAALYFYESPRRGDIIFLGDVSRERFPLSASGSRRCLFPGEEIVNLGNTIQ